MQTSPRLLSLPLRPAPPRPWRLASLQTLINTAGLVSVDLTDTVFATMPGSDEQANWAEVGPFALPGGPDAA
ncbi:MAG: hypothetical protein PSV13_18500 [Lacunisphaera sp.]|nr:hypothetical protein [Lacunisphaera sp.]